MKTNLIESGKRWLINSFRSPKKSIKVLITVSLLCIPIIILGVIVYKQRDILLTYNWQFHPLPFGLAFIFFCVSIFMSSLVWGYIVNNVSQRISYQKHIYYYILSNLAKRMPGTIWYVASRAQMYSEEGVSITKTSLASGLEMAFIALAGVVIALLFSTEIIVRYHLNPIIFIILLIVGIILLQPKFIKWYLKLFKIDGIRIDYKLLGISLISYAIIWILGGLLLYEIGNIVYPIPSSQLGYVIGSWTIVGVISILFIFSPTNFGITELGLSLLLTKIVPLSIAVVISVTSRILIIIFEISLALIFLGVKRLRKGN